MLKKLVAGFSAVKIGKALLDLGKDALQAASDLQEVQNVVDVTFGGNSNQIEKWAKSAGDQFGLTETQAKKFASTMGAMLKSSGLAGEQIVDVSTDLAGLAADMASFYNLDFEESFNKIRSGMSGITMPLKELGIDMSETALNAYALKQGLDKTYEQMDAGEKTMLRYRYLMQVTADAQGDFARTSDGYANAMRKLETNVDALKATLGKAFLDTVAEAVGALNGFLELLQPDESKKTVLDDFAQIDFDTQNKLENIAKVRSEADDLAAVLSGIFDAKDDNGQNAGDTVAKLGVKSEETAEYLRSLGLSTEEIDEKERDWLETCRRLVKTIPGLSSIINTETGEVNGGTQAVKDYIDAWEQGQKRLALLGALEKKKTAIEERFADIPGLELDVMVAEKRLRDNRKKMDDLLKKHGVSTDNVDYMETLDVSMADAFGFSNEDFKTYNQLALAEQDLEDNATKATDKLKNQTAALNEAEEAVREAEEAIKDQTKAVEESGNALDLWSEEKIANAKEALEAAKEALTALETHAEGVRTAVGNAIDNTVKGFDYIGNAAERQEQRLKPLRKEVDELDKTSKTYEKDLEKLQGRISDASDTYGVGNLKKNLASQLHFLEEYKADMEAAQALGFSNEFLAQFADGSVESAEWLHEIAQASESEKDALNAAYKDVQDAKKGLTDTLSQQQLSVDSVYQSLAEKAAEAVAKLDMEGDAAENSGKTIKGIADGISAHVPEVQSAVEDLLAQLDRLNGWGINVDLGGFGQINFTVSSGQVEGSARMGLFSVPHDDYIARLHEGERVLSAQEAQRYNTLLYGGYAGFDLESLGGVMRDNIKPGGNVYLDGKMVGAVVSDRQGRSYKSLQRSGWQG